MKKEHMSLEEKMKLHHYREIFKLYLSDIILLDDDEIDETIEKARQIIEECDEIISKYNTKTGVSYNKEQFFEMLTKLNETVKLKNSYEENKINSNKRKKIRSMILFHHREIFKLYLSDIMHLDDEERINKAIQKAIKIIEDYDEIINENSTNTGVSYDKEDYFKMYRELYETVKLRQYNEDNNIDQNEIERNLVKILAVALAGLIAIAAAGNLKSCSKEHNTPYSMSSTLKDPEL